MSFLKNNKNDETIEMEGELVQHPWNCDLKPPRNNFEMVSSHITKIIRKAIVKESSNNQYRSQIYIETVALSKFLSQRKNKYRSDKGFRTIQKVDKAVNRIYQMDLPSTFALIKLNSVDTFVPSRQFHQWFLIRLLSYAKLLDRMNYCCRYSATMLQHRLHTGHNWVEVMFALSMISRIWAVSKFLLKQICSTYEQLYSVLEQLPFDANEKKWPYNDYNMPANLQRWLSLTDFDVSINEARAAVPNISQHVKKDARLRKILKIQSHEQLRKFLAIETKKRSKNEAKSICLSNNLDALQWHMLTKKILKWVKLLKKADDQRRDKLLKKIKARLVTALFLS
ncbi:uncharacterized protein LOC135841796 [Planococcus citri]|uniref:uncharacterized protein LOC135841796 n=1 Tax=Planococcus citri TaxID=170843 RepID=UPI0031F87E7B